MAVAPPLPLLLSLLLASATAYLNARVLFTGRSRYKLSLHMAIAPFKAPRRLNAPGNLFVDESCIDCDVCRWMCPSVYKRSGIKSIVYSQPQEKAEKLQAYAAMVSCPTGSIRTHSPDPLTKEVADLFPAEISPDSIPGIFHLGYHSSTSFGAIPYLIAQPGFGNIMIDSPRFNPRLADNIEAMGGLHSIIITHKDDIADQAKWKKRFPQAQRIIHK
jgi:ferredoxin